MAIKALQEESVNRTPADIKAAKGNTDKCKGCNNVKGCITCVDGDQWAHIEEARTKVTKENVTKEKSKVLQCPHLATYGLSRFCLYGKFPANCEDCNCPDKKYIEITITNKIE